MRVSKNRSSSRYFSWVVKMLERDMRRTDGNINIMLYSCSSVNILNINSVSSNTVDLTQRSVAYAKYYVLANNVIRTSTFNTLQSFTFILFQKLFSNVRQNFICGDFRYEITIEKFRFKVSSGK